MIEKQRHGGQQPNAKGSGQNVHSKTAEQIATECGVDERTIRRDAKFAEAIDTIAKAAGDETRTAILRGELKVTKSDVVKARRQPIPVAHVPDL